MSARDEDLQRLSGKSRTLSSGNFVFTVPSSSNHRHCQARLDFERRTILSTFLSLSLVAETDLEVPVL